MRCVTVWRIRSALAVHSHAARQIKGIRCTSLSRNFAALLPHRPVIHFQGFSKVLRMTWSDFLQRPFITSGHSRRRRLVRSMSVDSLEPRLLLTAPTLTDSEQYMLELVNRARANPSAEAARYKIGLNSGLSGSELITTAPKQPLAPQQNLTKAALLHRRCAKISYRIGVSRI
jgi:hypothetical protein